MDEEEAVKYFRQILSAVGYCHSFNICHRDLKPENILLTKSLDIKIADFGMAALHQSPDHKLKTSCGSPHYAAPELIRGATYRGDRVDIWSMGVILYATLAGRLPFDVEGHGKDWLPPLLSKIKKGTYEMAPEFSDEAANLIWRILQVNPRDRINLHQIWRHPLIRKYDHLDSFGGGANPLLPSLRTCPILRRSDISKELIRHLRSLWHRLSEQELVDALLGEEYGPQHSFLVTEMLKFTYANQIRPNDQKLFYGLLLKYRDAQLENYTPDIGYSNSDYHHVRPQTMTKTYSTRHFPQSKNKGHGRQISRFTVISNAAETEQSYDPFKASRPQHLDSIRTVDRAKITIHCTKPSADGNEVHIQATPKLRHPSGTSVAPSASHDRGTRLKVVSRQYASRSSLASSSRSRQNLSYRAPVGYKRGVSFSHIRRGSGASHKVSINQFPAVPERPSNHTEVIDDGGSTIRALAETPASARYIRSRKVHPLASQKLDSPVKPSRLSLLWTEDVRQLSSSLAKDCDEAFNRSSVASQIEPDNLTNNKSSSSLQQSQVVKEASYLIPPEQTLISKAKLKNKLASLDSRPLPPPPSRSDSIKIDLIEARKHAELRKTGGGDDCPGYLDRMVSHIDRLIQPASPVSNYMDRRISSAPAEVKRTAPNKPLPSIYEAGKEDDSPHGAKEFEMLMDTLDSSEAKNNRVASAPGIRVIHNSDPNDRSPRSSTNARDLTNPKDTIRVVQPSLPNSPVQIPAPLTIRKKSSQMGPWVPFPDTEKNSCASRHRQSTLELRHLYNAGSKMDITPDLGRIEEDQLNDELAESSNSGTIVKKKSIWFKRSSRSDEDRDWRMSIGGGNNLPSQSSSNDTVPPLDGSLPVLPKKKFSFGRLFKKRSSKPDINLNGKFNINSIFNPGKAKYRIGVEMFDDTESVEDSILESQQPHQERHRSNSDDLRSRQIAPQRSWLAKLFNVKPASKYICFSVSKMRARQEIVAILKEWKRYGIRDVQVDKNRNIVFGRVAVKNCESRTNHLGN